MKKRVLHYSVLLIIFLTVISSKSVKLDNLGHRESPQYFSNYYYQRKSLFEALPRDSGSIVFVGNSITDFCEWNELFPGMNIKNRGISADITEGVLNRLDEIISLKPSKVFIMIGINDIGRSIPVDTIITNYNKIINIFQIHCPYSKLYIQSVLPVGEEMNKNRPIRSVIELNSKLKEMCLGNGIPYIDLYSVFAKPNGFLNSDVSNDGLHLMGNGYLKWKIILTPYVVEGLRDL